MWRDIDSFGPSGGGATLAFGFPDLGPPGWRQLWRSVVAQVAVTPTPDSKDELLEAFVGGRGVRTLGFVNAHALNSCVRDPGFARDLLGLQYLVRDGIGVHALYRLIGSHSGLNLNGTDLLPDLIARFAGKRIALFGTELHVVERVGAQLRREIGCDIVVAHGFHADGHYLEHVARTRPDLVVLGMGMPKQERVAMQMKHGLHQDVAIVCGGAILDFLSGEKPRAPLVMRRAGLEWAFRLGLEPKRLFGRYVIGNPLFLIRSAILAALPKSRATRSRALPERPPIAEAFGLGGPVTLGAPPSETSVPALPRAVAVASVVPPTTDVTDAIAVSAFSANRPVVARDDLFGRRRDLDRLLAWVLDQSGNALIYGPRGYGKTSLVRVFGEIADQRGHVVLYASCSRGIEFDALMRQYLSEIPPAPGAAPLPPEQLTVQQVATRLAEARGISLVLIIDEFDRIERGDTRERIVELIKDVSDLTAAVRFVLVGVATDAATVLGYHPSVQRCITCVPLARLHPLAIEELFLRKAAGDRLLVAPAEVRTVVELTAGSAYHAQLIGQKLVSEARRNGRNEVTRGDLDAVIDEILADAALMDASFARIAREMHDAGFRAALVDLARLALAEPSDLVVLADGDAAAVRLCAALTAGGVFRPGDTGRGFRFVNAFMPQMLLMIAHRARASVRQPA